MEDTPLGRMIALRREDNPEVLRKITPEQRRLRSDWVSFRRAHRQTDPAAEKRLRAEMVQLQAALRAAFAPQADRR